MPLTIDEQGALRIGGCSQEGAADQAQAGIGLLIVGTGTTWSAAAGRPGRYPPSRSALKSVGEGTLRIR